MRFVYLLGAGLFYFIINPLLILGVIDAIFKCEGEMDIKKIVAYQTVVEMQILTMYLFTDFSCFCDFILYYLPTHC